MSNVNYSLKRKVKRIRHDEKEYISAKPLAFGNIKSSAHKKPLPSRIMAI